jgi:hypothetical protein
VLFRAVFSFKSIFLFNLKASLSNLFTLLRQTAFPAFFETAKAALYPNLLNSFFIKKVALNFLLTE